jgi:orotate phosphoribosyltransferase
MGQDNRSIRDRMVKFYPADDNSIAMNAVPGHFATSSSHINFYIDVTSLKVRARDAKAVARSIRNKMLNHVSIVDTIVCMDGTDVVGAYLAEELELSHFANNNKHDTIYVVSPEVNSINQLLFRENIRPSIEGKNVLLLLATMTTGETVRRSLECIEYYGGNIAGVSAIFGTMTHVGDTEVFPIFTINDLPGYHTYAPHECPYCKKGIPIEAMVNGFGYSKL